MPTYRVRHYYSVYEDYLVDAPDLEKAQALVDDFMSQRHPVTQVECVCENEGDDYHDTLSWLVTDDDEEELIE